MNAKRNEFRTLIQHVATTLPDISGVPCHLRRVAIKFHMEKGIGAFAQGYYGSVHFSRSTMKLFGEFFDTSTLGYTPVEKEELCKEVVNEVALLTHELFHLRYTPEQSIQNYRCTTRLIGLKEFNEALTSVLAEDAVPDVLEQCGFSDHMPSILTVVPDSVPTDYDYVIVPALRFLINEAAKREGISPRELTRHMATADDLLEAAACAILPFLPDDSVDRVSIITDVIEIFALAHEEFKSTIKTLIDAYHDEIAEEDIIEHTAHIAEQATAQIRDSLSIPIPSPARKGRTRSGLAT